WLSDVENTLALTDWYGWTDAFLWLEFEAMLARRLEPALRNAAQASSRRQAVEVGEPIPVRLSDLEIVHWSEQEARRQAQLIAGETRAAMLEASETLEIMGLPVDARRRVLLEGGLFALPRRYARAALRPMRDGGVEAFDR